jgi:hypothetical protein
VFNFLGYKRKIKTTLRFHLTPVRLAIIKGNNNNKYWRRCGETRTLYTSGGNATTMESSMEIPQKTR